MSRKRKAGDVEQKTNKKQKTHARSEIEVVKAATIMTCGTGDLGQLGLTSDKPEVRRPFPVLKDVNVVQALARFQHCMAVLEEGGKTVVYAWGNNDNGVLGLPFGPEVNSDEEFVPRKVTDLIDKDIRQVSLGMYHNSAIDGEGRLYLWGNYKKDDFLGLRSDKHKDDYLVPQLYPFLNVTAKCKQVVSGGNFTVVLMDNGELYEMGWTGKIDQARVTREKKSALNPRKLIGCPKMSKILGCGVVSAFAEDENGDVYAWGFNHQGQLGLGHTKHHERPTRVPTLSNLKQFSCGDYHCLALTKDNHVYVWGQGTTGQLGIVGPEFKAANEKAIAEAAAKAKSNSEGTTQPSAPDYPHYLATPTKLDFFGDKKVKIIACGDSHSIAILESGEMYHWGGVQGLYIDGDIDILTTPTLAQKISPVVSKLNVVTLTAGATHNLFVIKPPSNTSTSANANETNTDTKKDTEKR